MTKFEKIASDCRAAADYYDAIPGIVGRYTMGDIYKKLEAIAMEADRTHKIAVTHIKAD